MKILKFSLMAITMLTVFLTSCEKNVSDTNQNDLSAKTSPDILIMPHGFENLSKEDQTEYFESLSIEDIEELKENNRIGMFLESVNKIEEVAEKLMSDGLLFSDVELNKVLSNEELGNLNSYNYSYNYDEITLESRGACWCWSFRYSYYHPSNCAGYPSGHNCCKWKVYRRKCLGWSGTYYQYAHINVCSGSALSGFC